MRFLIAGGGTGGHIFPAITIAQGLRERFPDARILFVGSERGMEAELVPRSGFDIEKISISGFERRLSFSTLKTALRALRGGLQSERIIRRFRPDVVIGTGGYVCGPVLFFARLHGIPAMIHEQNAIPGITNRILGRMVNLIAVTYDESKKYFPQNKKIILTGNPVRPVIMAKAREEGAKALGLDPSKKTLLVFGGSQGARAINRNIGGVLKYFSKRKDLQLIYQTGKYDLEQVRETASNVGITEADRGRIIIEPFIYNMEDAYAAADLALCRAGAISIAELTVKGIPSILIPLPTAAENHQEMNARVIEKHGAGIVILERDVSEKLLVECIDRILSSDTQLRELSLSSRKLGRPDAGAKLVGCVAELMSSK